MRRRILKNQELPSRNAGLSNRHSDFCQRTWMINGDFNQIWGIQHQEQCYKYLEQGSICSFDDLKWGDSTITNCCLWGVRLHRIDLSLFEALCFKLASINQLCFCGISHGISMVKPPEIYQSSSIRLFWGWLSLSLWTASSILQWGFMGWSALFWDHGPPFQMGVPKSWVILILHPLVLLPTSSFWYPLVS